MIIIINFKLRYFFIINDFISKNNEKKRFLKKIIFLYELLFT
jgi:hypothetical protein